jgi:uncharacterized membrane protein
MNNKFDELTRNMAQSVTRRAALKKFGLSLAGMALACFGLANIGRAGSPTYTTIDFPGAVATLAVDINDAGQIVGRYIDAGGINHGYLLNEDVYTGIDFPGASFTRAIGINRNGEIVGSYYTPDDKGQREHGFLLRGGVFSRIDVPGAIATLAIGINSSGDIAGHYLSATSDIRHGFVLHAGAFLTIDYPGSKYTEAWRINDSGQIAGRYVGVDGNFHVYLLSNGRFTSFDYPNALQTAPAGYSHVGGLNNFADVASDYASSAPFQQLNKLNGNVHGFVSSGGAFTSFDFPGASGTIVFGINDDGKVVGTYENPDGTFHGFLRNP